MLEFETRIAEWRGKLQQSIGDAESVAELEEHLRELLVAESKLKPADEAWHSAVRRLGETAELAKEFKKVRGSERIDSAVYWATLLLLAFVLAGLIMPMIAGLREGRASALLVTHVAFVTIGYTLTIAGGLIGLHYAGRGFFGRRSNRTLCQRLPWTVTSLSAAAIPVTLIGIVLGALWASEHRGIAWNWDIQELSAVLVVLAQVAIVAVHRSNLSTRFTMACATVACSVALFAWFSPALLQLQSYGQGAAIALLIAHLISALIMLTGIRVAIGLSPMRA